MANLRRAKSVHAAAPLALAAILMAAFPGKAGSAYHFNKMKEDRIASALANIHRRNPGLDARIAAVSGAFVGTPYKLGPLGEGGTGEFDRDPLYSFRQADCTTFVETVMALSLEPELGKALADTLRRIRYEDGKVGYAARNHFTEVDWIPNNAAAGFLADITEAVAGGKTRYAAKTISKRDWYAHKTLDDIQGFGSAPAAEKEAKLKALQALGKDLPDQEVRLPYVPVEALAEALPRIPSGTVANVVREGRPDKPVLITHQTLVIDKGGKKLLRHAAYGRQVEDVPVLDYFAKFSTATWRVLGVNLNAVRSR
ncbi:MAG: DUF1460 domain-containing protein [Elusimicrobia bacterium]|nr:DUF1460 domain-containing protein [Elusimicrobiota bacterium]